MGEAKRRKLNDPSYGRPPHELPGESARGLIISCPIEVQSNNRVFVRSSAIDPQELRFSLLFWDKLIWPSNPLIHVESDADAHFLESQKILLRPLHVGKGKTLEERLVTGFADAFSEVDAYQPGRWSIAQGENSLLLRENRLIKEQGILVELHRAIPVPDKDVPLQEILEFRRKRNDELASLRNSIDTFLPSVVSAQNYEAALASATRKIDDACANALKVSSEWEFPVRLSNLKTSIDLKPFQVAAGALAGLAVQELVISNSWLAGALASTGLVSALKITGDFGWVGLRDRSSPYRYVSQFHDEVF